MKKVMLGLSSMLLASGIALATDYSKLSNEDMIKSLQEDNIAKNEEENFKKARETYHKERKLFFDEFKHRIDTASKDEKEALEKAFYEYRTNIHKETQAMHKMPHKKLQDKNTSNATCLDID
ncbi:hypothetical protein CCY99_08110 [Helicobacter sp. 16-1353]|uniref:hypothetical protein n=1 Tax=Helicobacter sp. 16-1353 TaxID=2004996 RepID=UPI000DCAF2EE|nr:hypothetical protein [Helicobacter sp. 16-1353]RAX51913.1 hypothetical protein CCY99_08110 [Helicobacter sp. 16-1353]